jgi:DNA-binding transcriptional regulator GbsR (MarR family)
MTEPKGTYKTEAEEALDMLGKGYDAQPAAIIESPRDVLSLQDKGLVDYKVWGWVKLSAKFRPHIKLLRGAKVSVWLCIALSIDEDGKFSATLKELQELTGYSHTEILASIKELEGMGYLSVNRGGRKNLYEPNFAARGENNPKESLLKKVESTPQHQVDSTPSVEKPQSSIKELKESLTDEQLKFLKKAGMEWLLVKGGMTLEEIEVALQETKQKTNATVMFEKALGFSKPLPWWSNKDWSAFAEWVTERHRENATCFGEYNIWRNEKYTKGGVSNNRIRGFVAEFYDSWDMFKMAHPDNKSAPAAIDGDGIPETY